MTVFQHRRTREGPAVFCVFWGERVLPLPRPLSREGRGEVLLTVTGCYKSAKEKGKVLPLFADKLNNEEIRPLEEA
jgi:hypothetical protein